MVQAVHNHSSRAELSCVLTTLSSETAITSREDARSETSDCPLQSTCTLFISPKCACGRSRTNNGTSKFQTGLRLKLRFKMNLAMIAVGVLEFVLLTRNSRRNIRPCLKNERNQVATGSEAPPKTGEMVANVTNVCRIPKCGVLTGTVGVPTRTIRYNCAAMRAAARLNDTPRVHSLVTAFGALSSLTEFV